MKQRHPILRAIQRQIPSLLIAGALLALTLGLWLNVRRGEQADVSAATVRAIELAGASVDDRLDDYANALYAISGLFQVSESVGQEDFDRFCTGMDLQRRCPGLVSVAFVTPPAREGGYRVQQVHRFFRTAPAVGTDIRGLSHIRRLLDRAKHTNSLRVSEPSWLAFDDQIGRDVVMALPIFRAAGGGPRSADQSRTLLGWVVGQVDVSRVIDDPLGGALEGARIDAFDITGPTVHHLYGDSPDDDAVNAPGDTARDLRVGGRVWRLTASTTPAVGDAIASPWLSPQAAVLAAGLPTALLGYALVHALMRTRRQAIAEARRMTLSLARREAESRKLSLVAARTDNAVIITDADGKVEWVNDGFTRITGYLPHEVMGTRPGHLLQGPETDAATVERIRANLARGEGFVEEIINYAKNGRKYWINVEVQPIHNDAGVLTNFMAIETDVTERRAFQDALKQAKQDAESANHAKSDFLAKMSHEIRTPLNGVTGMTDLLATTDLTPQQRRYTGMIRSSAAALMGVISEILDFSKIEAGRIELQEEAFDLHDLVDDVAAMISAPAAAQKIGFLHHIRPGVPRFVHADPDRLRQVLLNLANNAVKFTERGQVTIEVAPAAPPRQNASGSLAGASEPGTDAEVAAYRFSVRDTGVGIEPSQHARLFQPFRQVAMPALRRIGGTGLGLAICKQLVELMHGEIGLDSAPDQGSVFWFVIPLKTAEAIPGSSRREVSVGQGFPALVVDAVDDRRDALADQLRGMGFHVTSADTVSRALAMAKLQYPPFHVVVVDESTSDVSELKLAADLLSASPGNKPVLLRVGAIDAADGDTEAFRGFTATLARPVQSSDLFDAIVQSTSPVGRRASVDEASSIVPKGSRSARILVAEDNEVNQLVVTEMLKRVGFAAAIAVDGESAVRMASAERFDLILMDSQMPGIDGIEATRQIRQLQAEGGLAAGTPSPLPIIALTANALKGERGRYLAAGMDDYLTKPIDPRKLIETINRWLSEPAGVGDGSGREASAKDSELQGGRNADARVHPNVGEVGSRVNSLPGVDSPLPIDVKALFHRCLEDASLARTVLDVYAHQTPQTLSRMDAALSSGDWHEVGVQAHAIKGAAANLSAERVRSAAESLEAAAARPNPLPGTAVAVADDLRRAHAAVIASMDAILSAVEELDVPPQPVDA